MAAEAALTDKDVCGKFLELQRALIEVRREMQGTDRNKYPFCTESLNELAKEVACAHIMLESKVIRLLIELLHCKGNVKDDNHMSSLNGVEQKLFFDQICVFQAWFQNLHQVNASHTQAFMTLLEEFLKVDASRTSQVQQCARDRMKCPKHQEPAVARSMDGKALQCKKCFAEEEEEKGDKVVSVTPEAELEVVEQ